MKKTRLLIAAAIAFAAVGCKKGDDAPSAATTATGPRIKEETHGTDEE